MFHSKKHYFQQFPSDTLITNIINTASCCFKQIFINRFRDFDMLYLQINRSQKSMKLVYANHIILGCQSWHEYIKVKCGYINKYSYIKRRFFCVGCARKFEQKLAQMQNYNWSELQRIRIKQQQQRKEQQFRKQQQRQKQKRQQQQKWNIFLKTPEGEEYLLRKQAQEKEKREIDQKRLRQYKQSQTCFKETIECCSYMCDKNKGICLIILIIFVLGITTGIIYAV